MSTPAAYPGHCRICDEPIVIGDNITAGASRSSWVHADCAHPAMANLTTVCRWCHLIGRLSAAGLCPDCEAER